jgi:DNA-directed RNA polymerase beta' subunit
MTVHLPFSLKSQAKSRLFMLSHIILLSPAIGDHICVPTQDMFIYRLFIGLYILTTKNHERICIYIYIYIIQYRRKFFLIFFYWSTKNLLEYSPIISLKTKQHHSFDKYILE